MAHTKLTTHKRTIVMPTRRTRFTFRKCIPTHLVEALRSMEEEPPVEAPMEEPLEDQMEDEHMDEETEEGPMFEEPIEIEESGRSPWKKMDRVVRMELVILMMEMILIILILMMGIMMEMW